MPWKGGRARSRMLRVFLSFSFDLAIRPLAGSAVALRALAPELPTDLGHAGSQDPFTAPTRLPQLRGPFGRPR